MPVARTVLPLTFLIVNALVWAPASTASPQGTGDSRIAAIAGSIQLRDSNQTQPFLVQLRSQFGGLINRVSTTSSGRFEFFNLQPGQYDLVVEANGFKKVNMRVEYNVAPIHGLMIYLEPEETAGPAAPTDAVSVRVLQAPPKARDEYHKGMENVSRKELDEGIGHFRKAVERYPDFDEAYLQLGLAHLQKDDAGSAQQAFQNATRSNPQSDRAFLLLGRSLRMQKMLPEAVTALEQSVKLKEDSWFAQMELGELLVSQGRFDDAYPHIARAHTLNAKEASIHQLYYNGLIRKNQHREALAELDEFLKLFPSHALAAKARLQREALQKFLEGAGKQ